MRIERRDLVVSAFLAVLVLAFFHNALLRGEQFYAGDTYRFFYPLKRMAADLVRSGEAPLWNPLVHSGAPLHAALQSAVFYPFSVLFYFFPFDFAFKWYIALHVLLAALATYFLMRRWQLDRLPAFAAAITYAFSGYLISFIDGLNIFSSIAWLPLVFAAFESAVEQSGVASVSLASLAVAAQTLAGDPVSGYCTFLICGAYWLILIGVSAFSHRPRAETSIKFSVLPMIAILAFFLSYVQIGPSQEFAQNSTRSVAISYDSATQYSLAPQRLLTLIAPYLFGNPIEDVADWGRIFSPRFPLERTLYVGAMPLALMMIAVAAFRERRVYFFAGVFVVSLLLSLGRNTPIYHIPYRILPVFAMFRYPVKFFFATTFATSVLCGYGLQYLTEGNAGGTHRLRASAEIFTKRFSAFLAATAVTWLVFAACDRFLVDVTGGLLLRFSSVDAQFTHQFIPYMKKQAFQAAVVFALLGAGLRAYKKGFFSRNFFKIFVAAFLILDLLPVSYRAMDTTHESFYSAPRIDSTLRADGEMFRLYRTPIDMEQHLDNLPIRTAADYYLWNREILSPNFGTLFGYAYTDGYDSANLLWHNLFLRFVEGSPPLVRPRLLGLLNVKYIFSSHPLNHPDLILRNSLSGNVFLYENVRCLERAYFVPNSIVASSESVALRVLASNGFEPKTAVVLVDKGGPGSLNPGKGAAGFDVSMPKDFKYQTMNVSDEPSGVLPHGPSIGRPDRPSNKSHLELLHGMAEMPAPLAPVRIESYGPNSVVLSVNAPYAGYVVLCDAYYPNWKARINGLSVKVLRANCTVRAIPVKAGNSIIEFAYDKDSFHRAAIVSAVTIAVCVAGIVVRRRMSGKRA